MKHLFQLAIICLLSQYSFAQQTISSSLNPEGSPGITVDIKNNKFSAENTKESKFKIEVQIQANYPKEVIDELIRIGRYKVTTSSARESFIIKTPNLNKPVTIGGAKLTEDISIKLFMPKGYTNKSNSVIKPESIRGISESVEVTFKFAYGNPPASSKAPTTSNNLGAAKGDSKTVPRHVEVQGLYGDIIMGSIPLDDFYD